MAAVSPAQPDPRITTLCGLAAVPNPPCFISRSLDAVTRHHPPPAARASARDLSGWIGAGHHSMTIAAARSATGPRPSGPAGGAQPAPDPMRNDRQEPRIGPQVRGDPDRQMRVARAGARRRPGQVAPDVPPQIEEVGNEKDSRHPAPDAPLDSGGDIRPGRLEEAGLDDASGKPGVQIPRQTAQQPVGRPDAAAVTDEKQSGPLGRTGRPQRASPRIAAVSRRSPSTTTISPPAAASSSRT